VISFDVLINAPTEDRIFSAIVAKLKSLGIPADQWNNRGVAISVIRGLANTGANLGTLITNGIKSRFVGRDENGDLLATGGALDLAANYDFNVEREGSSFAEVTLLVSNAGANVYAFQPGTFQYKSSVTGKAYVNTTLFDLNPSDTNIPVAMVAVESGTGSNAAPGDITQQVAPADSKVTATNPSAAIATDSQGDDDLTTACTDKIGSWSLDGPRGAYDTAIRVALRDDNNLPVNVNRWQKLITNSKGTVAIYLASPTGTVDSHDIAGVINSIETLARPDTVTVNVSSSMSVPTSGTLTIWAKTTQGVTEALIASAVNASLEAQIEEYPIGGIATTTSQGYLYAETIEGWAQSAHPSIFKVDYTGADLPLNAGQVAELTATLDIRFITVS
jgi:hypothetical protein